MKKICENPAQGVSLGISEDGGLRVLREGAWREIEGKPLPPCVFNDILYARDDFYVAATTDEGAAAVWATLKGEVFTPVNLLEQHFWADGKPPRGGAVRLFFEPVMSQLLLVTSGGDVAIIPECAKCVRLLRLTDRTVTGAEYADHRLTLICADGETETHSLAADDQIRVSVRHAIDRCKAGNGEIIDIRPNAVREKEGRIPCTVALDPEELDDWLTTIDKDRELYFICSFGTQADQAAWHAYYNGYPRARSIGGLRAGLHID